MPTIERIDGYQPIENHGVIGDLNTVALVGMDGAIDFMCFPRFDSPSVFCSLLDEQKGGEFSITPKLREARAKQLYLPDTNVLLTRFLSADGIAELQDFMPVESSGVAHNLVRRARCVRGHAHFRLRCAPRFDYARAAHEVTSTDDGVVFCSRGADGTALRLRASITLDVAEGDAVAAFSLTAGKQACFLLEDATQELGPDRASPEGVERAFAETVDFWQRWVAHSTYRGRWREMVNRSALVLKLLTSARFGSMVAAPTFGLPEEIGGVRNWDYRYTWIRDASFTLYALMRLGFSEEAAAFMRWLEERCARLHPEGSMQVMFGIDGRPDLVESTLDHLEGYRGSRPVRIGNAAHRQVQLDIYGDLLDSVYLHDRHGQMIAHDLWANLVRMVDWVCAHWREEDDGIWEVRGGRRQFLFSRLMCWVAVDRGLRIATRRSFPAPLDRWYRVRDEIYHDIYERFWDHERQTFVQHRGSRQVDAACLLMPLVRFISPHDARWRSTMQAVEQDLLDDSLVYRYRAGRAADDGLTGREGTFSMCSFWYVECLARAGELERARLCFEKMLGYANHLGLYGEELGPCGEQLGNFPQAFTHLALISAAFDLDRRLSASGRP